MDLVLEIPNHLCPETCKKIIDRFESSSKKTRSLVCNKLDPNLKNGLQIAISRHIEWEDIADLFDEKLKDGLEKYKTFLNEKLPIPCDQFIKNLKVIDGYTVEKTISYGWHSDFLVKNDYVQNLKLTWHLNTRAFDGETDFIFKNIKHECGKLVISPAAWDFVYKENQSSEKYSVTVGLFSTTTL